MSKQQKSSNVVWHAATVTRDRREQQNGHRGGLFWFTGLSGAGKSTLAHSVEEKLHDNGYRTFVLDGDNVRHGLCADLSFSDDDRKENIRRVGEVAKLGADAGLIVLAAFISPFRSDRRIVRDILPEGQFVEVFVDAPLEVCKNRDPKGLYEKAVRGEIKQFTGIDSPYENPQAAEVHLDADALTVAESVNRLLEYLHGSGVLKAGYAPVSISA
jgi:adenylylsulfate kinase